MTKDEATTAVNIRSFPTDLLWKAKAKAADNRMTLQEFVIRAVQKAVSDE